MILGGISSKDNPADPAGSDSGWIPENRLFHMFFVIADITMGLVYFVGFYQTMRALTMYKPEKGANIFAPNTNGKCVCISLFYIIFIG